VAEDLSSWVARTSKIQNPGIDYFIAGPYTDPDEAVKQFRYEALTRAYAQYIANNHTAVCCITLTHPPDQVIAKQKGIATLGSDYWTDADVPFMNISRNLVVVKLPGWEKSTGTQKEIAYFRAQGKPILYIEPSEFILGTSPDMPPGLPQVSHMENAKIVKLAVGM